MIKRYKVVFSNGMETSVTSRSFDRGLKAKVWEVWRAFWWKEESVVVVEEETGRKWTAVRTEETGMWPRWKEVTNENR